MLVLICIANDVLKYSGRERNEQCAFCRLHYPSFMRAILVMSVGVVWVWFQEQNTYRRTDELGLSYLRSAHHTHREALVCITSINHPICRTQLFKSPTATDKPPGNMRRRRERRNYEVFVLNTDEVQILLKNCNKYK